MHIDLISKLIHFEFTYFDVSKGKTSLFLASGHQIMLLCLDHVQIFIVGAKNTPLFFSR